MYRYLPTQDRIWPLPPEQSLHARDNLIRAFFRHWISIPAELEVDAPDTVGLLVQQHGLIWMKGRIEPEPTLGGKFAAIFTSAIKKRSRNVCPELV